MLGLSCPCCTFVTHFCGLYSVCAHSSPSPSSCSVIDVLKVDIEGSEWEAFFHMGYDEIPRDPDVIPMHNPWPPIGQVMIELHAQPKYRSLVPKEDVRSFIQLFYDRGFGMFHKEINVDSRWDSEYAFIVKEGWPL